MLYVLAKKILNDPLCSALRSCFWGELQRDFLELYGLLDLNKLMTGDFQPTTWMRMYRSACQAKDLPLICYDREDLLPWKKELLAIQFSWNSGIPMLACWHQRSECQEAHNVLRGTSLLLWISCRNYLNKNPCDLLVWEFNIV